MALDLGAFDENFVRGLPIAYESRTCIIAGAQAGLSIRYYF